MCFYFYHIPQACIKPIEVPKDDGKGSKKRERVQVSLTDCLACSGCVTSAETVLINQQSHQEFLKVLDAKKRGESGVIVVVVSLSHQTIASFAAKYLLSFQDSALKLVSFFKSLGVDYVFDLTLARHLSLIEESREFIEKYKKKEKSLSGPILSSICPGWVCYAEKTHGNLVPLLSQVKSPQQIMGSLVKSIWRKQNDKLPAEARIYHATIMPCFDKKLEASRRYFINEETKEADVDTVLTPIELEQLLQEQGLSFPDIQVSSEDRMDKIHSTIELLQENGNNEILSHSGSGSGGHAENVILATVQRLVKENNSESSVSWDNLVLETKKNKDFIEVSVSPSVNGNNDPKITFAIINGFRNIQTLVQKIKRNKCEYDFVEVMACPSGCLNGGAQLRPLASSISWMNQPPTQSSGDGLTSSKIPTETGLTPSLDDYSDRIKKLYDSLKKTSLPVDPDQEVIQSLYKEWFSGDEELRRKVFYTEFKAVPKTTNLLTMTW